jgi:cysteine desulfurase
MVREIYFDNNATTRCLDEVRAAVLSALGERFGNPSSVHSAGERARAQLAHARESVAALLGADPDDLIFTSSGTEANNTVLHSIAAAKPRCRIVTTTTEHSSILKTCERLQQRGAEIVLLPINELGRINPADLERALAADADLVSIHWVNNETGVIQTVREIAELCRARGVAFHRSCTPSARPTKPASSTSTMRTATWPP